jgi:hypothetical protein
MPPCRGAARARAGREILARSPSPTIEDYAQRRLGLRRAALYKYLQVHDWLRDHHPAWLVRRPKRFIPELSDASALVWIERKLRDRHSSDSFRAELEESSHMRPCCQ